MPVLCESALYKLNILLETYRLMDSSAVHLAYRNYGRIVIIRKRSVLF